MNADFMTKLAEYESMLDPWLTDEEIIYTFTPLENQFFDWLRSDKDARVRNDASRSNTFLGDALQELWPDEDRVLEKYLIFNAKWEGRHLRRINHQVLHDDLITLVFSTRLNEPSQLAKTLSVLTSRHAPSILLGESNFGGSLAAYAIDIDVHSLFSDIPVGNITNFGSPFLLDLAIMAVDESLDPSLPSDLDISVYSAQGDQFRGEAPTCFLQLGDLMISRGQDWIDARDNPDVSDAGWQSTGYNAVVILDAEGYPTGPVCVVYNFYPFQKDDDQPFGDWRGIKRLPVGHDGQELPHVRRLYPGCDQKFFMAKIADSLLEIDADAIDFDVVLDQRRLLVRTKMDGSRIIPNDVMGHSFMEVDTW